jgi:hypothetical protein
MLKTSIASPLCGDFFTRRTGTEPFRGESPVASGERATHHSRHPDLVDTHRRYESVQTPEPEVALT